MLEKKQTHVFFSSLLLVVSKMSISPTRAVEWHAKNNVKSVRTKVDLLVFQIIHQYIQC